MKPEPLKGKIPKKGEYTHWSRQQKEVIISAVEWLKQELEKEKDILEEDGYYLDYGDMIRITNKAFEDVIKNE